MSELSNLCCSADYSLKYPEIQKSCFKCGVLIDEVVNPGDSESDDNCVYVCVRCAKE